MNAVLKCQIRGNKQNGWIMAFCTYQPCLRCLQAMLQIGVRIIIYRKSYRDVWRDRYLQETKTLFDIRKYNENNELFVMSGNAYYSEFAANKNKGQQTTPFIYWDGI